MSADYDELPFEQSDEMQSAVTFVEPTERKCRRHRWVMRGYLPDGKPATLGINFHLASEIRKECQFCLKPYDEAASRRGKQSRNYGNRAELQASRKYGGEKIGAAGGPVDIRGKDFSTQMKTHRRLPPTEWVKAFAKMSQENRTKRLLLRFVQGPCVPPKDYFVFEADDFLACFGKDE